MTTEAMPAQGPVDVTVRPPLGLRPEWVAEYHNCRDRLIEIVEAMTRYAEAGKPAPLDWCQELGRRIENYVPPPREFLAELARPNVFSLTRFCKIKP